jgi:hypothetical protein
MSNHPLLDWTVDTSFHLHPQQSILAAVSHFGGDALLAEDIFDGLQDLVKISGFKRRADMILKESATDCGHSETCTSASLIPEGFLQFIHQVISIV